MKRNIKFSKIFILFAIFILLIAGCSSTPKEKKGLRLFGMLYDDYNQPVGGAKVQYGDNSFQYTDTSGRFIIPDAEAGSYNFIITKDLHEPLEALVELIEPDQVLYLKIVSLAFLKERTESSIEKHNYKEALTLLKRARLIAEDDPVLYFLESLVYYKLENWNKALEPLYFLVEQNQIFEEVFELIFLIYETYPDPDKEDLINDEYQSFLKRN
ncbi:MAG: carboxypeptidase-like regulatory domain-containing protein [Spirochaetales bacterium]|nr:carboxypeptidase-like regulatory domain-containing protein [Spirochaetales bacterium]